MNINQEDLNFNEIKGFDATLKRLTNLQSSEKMPRSILFTGREGIGKRLFTKKLAASFTVNKDFHAINVKNVSQ